MCLVTRTTYNYNLQGDTDSPTRDTPSSKYTCNYTCLYYTFNIKGKFFCKGGARSNPSNRGDPFLASLRAIMGEGGMDTTTDVANNAPPAQRRYNAGKP